MSKGSGEVRYAEVERESLETRVQVVLDLDGGTKRDIMTGIPFFDHMLKSTAYYSGIDLGVQAEGDLPVDDHHTVEDVGICIGRAIRAALVDSQPIERFGSAHGVMDDALVLCALDISGRGMLFYDCVFQRDALGGLSTENVREFFRALAHYAGITIHIRKIDGFNDHHLCEAVFKAFGLALHQAVRRAEHRPGHSTKGMLD